MFYSFLSGLNSIILFDYFNLSHCISAFLLFSPVFSIFVHLVHFEISIPSDYDADLSAYRKRFRSTFDNIRSNVTPFLAAFLPYSCIFSPAFSLISACFSLLLFCVKNRSCENCTYTIFYIPTAKKIFSHRKNSIRSVCCHCIFPISSSIAPLMWLAPTADFCITMQILRKTAARRHAAVAQRPSTRMTLHSAACSPSHSPMAQRTARSEASCVSSTSCT